MFNRTPGSDITGSTFGNEGMDVRIPFEVTTKGMKNTDETGCEMLFFIHIRKHTKDDIPDRRKKEI